MSRFKETRRGARTVQLPGCRSLTSPDSANVSFTAGVSPAGAASSNAVFVATHSFEPGQAKSHLARRTAEHHKSSPPSPPKCEAPMITANVSDADAPPTSVAVK